MTARTAIRSAPAKVSPCADLPFTELDPRPYDRGVDTTLLEFGHASRQAGPLLGAYCELTFAPGFTELEGQIAIAAARASNPKRLRALARATGDAWPWAVFLRRLLVIPETAETRDAFERLYYVAEQLLEEQGLGLVRPEDLLAQGLERQLRPWVRPAD